MLCKSGDDSEMDDDDNDDDEGTVDGNEGGVKEEDEGMGPLILGTKCSTSILHPLYTSAHRQKRYRPLALSPF